MKLKNRLWNETSPYLLQHKNQPVDWFTWCEEAFEKARSENKPIFLSIGYSACHWCHVMAEDCFADESIARQMNDQFINIKVDREERPDLDAVYMKALISQTGQGGWPLSLFLTPKGEFYFGGTYFPSQTRHNQPGFPQILDQAQSLYREQHSQLKTRIQTVQKKIETDSQLAAGSGKLDAKWMDEAAQILFERFDETCGGFGSGMKFPEPMLYGLLLRHWRRFESQRSMEMLDKSLTRMAQGGICDQLGGGFHRYSTDRAWRVPHFEKMLCDNALLAKLYLETFQATKQEMYEDVPREIFDYVFREMVSSQGYFYSSQDADSEGSEGTYYVWELREVLGLLGPQHSKVFARVFGLSSGGNFEGHLNVLHLRDSLEKVSEEEGIPIFEVGHIIKTGKQILLENREKRPRPGRDEKMITAWNSMMITALATGAAVLNDPSYLNAAVVCSNFIWSNVRNETGLLRVFKDGHAKIPAFLEDYAFYLESQIAVYEASLEAKWIERALIVADELIDRFWDSSAGGFFIYGKHHERLFDQPKNPQDESQPSGNAVAALSLIKLARLTGKKDYRERGETLLRVFQSLLERQPVSVTGLLAALDSSLDYPTEIVLTGSTDEPEFKKMLREIHKDFRPNKILVYASGEASRQLLPITEGKSAVNGQPTVYVCQKGTCLAPIQSSEVLENQLERPPIIKVNIFDEEKSKQELEFRQNEDFLNAMSQIFKHSGFGKF